MKLYIHIRNNNLYGKRQFFDTFELQSLKSYLTRINFKAKFDGPFFHGVNLILSLGSEYFLCFPYAQHDEDQRKAFTETVFNFYDKFFPGITIHRKGKVKSVCIIQIILFFFSRFI